MAKKLTPEVEKRVKDVLKEWNKGWREQTKSMLF